jgi:hypothetical protein
VCCSYPMPCVCGGFSSPRVLCLVVHVRLCEAAAERGGDLGGEVRVASHGGRGAGGVHQHGDRGEHDLGVVCVCARAACVLRSCVLR